MNRMTVFAPAKLNLFLAVRPRRPDGFHEVETVTVLLELADQLEFQIGHDITESSFALTCESETPSHHVNQQDDIPQDDRNLVVQALKRLAEKSNTNIATAIRLIKRIPSQAGLGGGSSDAATTLAACCGLWNLQLDREYLAQIGSSLGSDVPLFLGPTYSLCRGRGEKTFPLFNAPGAKEPRLHFVLLKPCGGLNTGHVYSRFDASPVTCPGRVDQFVQVLANGNIEELGSLLFNSLEEPAFTLMPELETYKRAMQLPGVTGALMTGSGSCLFALCQNALIADTVASTLREQFPECFVLATASKKR